MLYVYRYARTQSSAPTKNDMSRIPLGVIPRRDAALLIDDNDDDDDAEDHSRAQCTRRETHTHTHTHTHETLSSPRTTGRCVLTATGLSDCAVFSVCLCLYAALLCESSRAAVEQTATSAATQLHDPSNGHTINTQHTYASMYSLSHTICYEHVCIVYIEEMLTPLRTRVITTRHQRRHTLPTHLTQFFARPIGLKF